MCKKMKVIKYIVLYILFINCNLYSLDLWQGFDDEMTKDEIVNHAITLFGENIRIDYINEFARVKNFPYGIIFAIKYNVPYGNTEIRINRRNREYETSEIFRGLIGIDFIFRNEKILFMCIKWNSSVNELLPNLTRQFGSPIIIPYVENSFFSSELINSYKWENNNRDVFLLKIEYSTFGQIIYLNHNSIFEYNRQLIEDERKKQDEQNKIDRNRREALNSIEF